LDFWRVVGAKDDTYIWDTLSTFRNGSYPIDAWISDFEWFTKTPDYSVKDPGIPDYTDFGYNNITFPHPVQQLQDYRSKLNLRFGGIRKPRLGNSHLLAMARSKNWTISGHDGGARNLNYSIPEVDSWYGKQEMQYLQDGVEFLWNDEGETTWYTYHWWNYAETLTLKAFKPNKRFFTINRAFTPGMQRMGATTWTGDVAPSWDDLSTTPGVMLNWGLAGNPIVTCDTGGFSGETNALLLARWYQLSVFMPVMRVHSVINTVPHFPFLWGDEAGTSMRKSLELRYRMIPTHYSFSHEMYRTGIPSMRTLLMEYPQDTAVAELTSEWLLGDSILVAPVMSPDNTTKLYLPAGIWYDFNLTQPDNRHQGPTTITLSSISLNHIPIYVKEGGVVALAPLVQYTDALPGNGELELQIYAGADGQFKLVEDDGETIAYMSSTNQAAVRTTAFTWDDANRKLSWSVAGTYSDRIYTSVVAKLFTLGAVSEHPPARIGQTGAIVFGQWE
jgi:alpha-glucosidase